MAIGIALGLWRKQAYYLVITALILFTFFTGATASVTRAAVMGFLALTAQYWGRMSRIFSAIVFAAAVMLLFNPYVLFWDAGFQLSFLALIGLVYLSPILKDVIARSPIVHWGDVAISSNSSRIKSLLNRGIAALVSLARNDTLTETLFATLSAIIATFPLILYQFGRFSIIAPLVNILVLWIIPYLMLFGFLSLIISFVIFPLGQLLTYLAIFGLKYVIIVTDFFGSWRFSAFQISLPLPAAIVLYILMRCLTFHYGKKNKSAIASGRL